VIKAFFAAVWDRVRGWALRLVARLLRWVADILTRWGSAVQGAADAVEIEA
jgi:hypothetical protein